MLESKIKGIIKQGEGLRIEFKECKTALNKDIYETVCAFLNRKSAVPTNLVQASESFLSTERFIQALILGSLKKMFLKS